MLSNMRPYTPSLYQGDGIARYRQYPRTVDTPIPGAGYDAKRLVWAEQELNLDGSSHPQDYGNYSRVPLRGLGAPTLTLTTDMLSKIAANEMRKKAGALPVPELLEEEIDYTAESYVPPSVGDKSNTLLYAGIAGAVVAVGGLAWFMLKK